MSDQIESRDGAEVYASDAGFVCIKQVRAMMEEQLVVIHPDDIPQLVELLEKYQQEALHIRIDPPGIRNA